MNILLTINLHRIIRKHFICLYNVHVYMCCVVDRPLNKIPRIKKKEKEMRKKNKLKQLTIGQYFH